MKILGQRKYKKTVEGYRVAFNSILSNFRFHLIESFDMTRPNGLIAKAGLELLTFGAPSGKLNIGTSIVLQ